VCGCKLINEHYNNSNDNKVKIVLQSNCHSFYLLTSFTCKNRSHVPQVDVRTDVEIHVQHRTVGVVLNIAKQRNKIELTTVIS